MRDRVLLSLDAILEGMDLATHGISVVRGHCDAFAGEAIHERIFHGNLLQAKPSSFHEVQLTFEIEHSSAADTVRILQRGPLMSLTCRAELLIDVFRTGLTLRRAYETGDLLGARDGAAGGRAPVGSWLHGAHGQSVWLRLVSGPTRVAWPSATSPRLGAKADDRLEVAVPAAAAEQIEEALEKVPLHVVAAISYVDTDMGALQINGSANSLVQMERRGQGEYATAVLSLPVRFAGQADLKLATAILSGQPMRSLMLKASNPSSPLALALGPEHSLKLEHDPGTPAAQDLYETLRNRGRVLSGSLIEESSSDAFAVILHQRLQLDNDTIGRVDVNITGGEQSDTLVDASLVLRQFGEGLLSSGREGWQGRRQDAVELHGMMRFKPGMALATFTGGVELLQNWSGDKSRAQWNQDASNNTVTVAYAYDSSMQFLKISSNWSEHDFDAPDASSNISTSLYTFASELDFDGEDGQRNAGFCRVTVEAPDLRVSFNWTVLEVSADVQEHTLALTGARGPGRSVYLAELSSQSRPTEGRSARRLLGAAETWYTVTSHHGADATCASATATSWDAQEEGFHVAIQSGMQPDGNPACFSAGFVRMAMSCNTTSRGLLMGMAGLQDAGCWFQFMQLLPGLPLCHWDTGNNEYTLDYCVGGIQDLPAEVTLYKRDGQIVKPHQNTTLDQQWQPPEDGFANTLMMQAGMSTTLRFTVDKRLRSNILISGHLEEENTCNVRADSGYEAVTNANWLPLGFTASNPQCRICSLGNRGFVEWITSEGHREVYDYCIPAKYTSSCCAASTWAEVLHPALDGLEIEINEDTPILGSTSWDRTQGLGLSGNGSSVDGLEAMEFAMSKDNVVVLRTSLAITDQPELVGLNLSMTVSSEGLGNMSNVTVVASQALLHTSEEFFGPGGFLAGASASMASSGVPVFHSDANVQYVSGTSSSSMRMSAAVATPDPLAGVEAALAYTASDFGSMLGVLAQLTGSDGAPVGSIKVQGAQDADALVCSATAREDASMLMRLGGSFTKSALGGNLRAELEEDGVLKATAEGFVPKNGNFYTGEVELRVHDAPGTFLLAVNASDGFLPRSEHGNEEFYASISGSTDSGDGFLIVRAEADGNSSSIASLGWDLRLSELMADSTRMDRLAGSAAWQLPHSRGEGPASVVESATAPWGEGPSATLVLELSPEALEAAGGAPALAHRATAAFGAATEVAYVGYEAHCRYEVSTPVTRVQAEEALAVLTGLQQSAIHVQIAPSSSTRRLAVGSRVTATITMQDLLVAKGVQLSAANAAALEAVHALQGVSGAVSISRAATIVARVHVRVAGTQVAPSSGDVQTAMGSADISVISVNTTSGHQETSISGAASKDLQGLAATFTLASVATFAVPALL